MKKLIIGILVLGCVFSAYCIGHKQGEDAVIYNQIITSESHTQGVYYAEYNGQVHEYWYD